MNPTTSRSSAQYKAWESEITDKGVTIYRLKDMNPSSKNISTSQKIQELLKIQKSASTFVDASSLGELDAEILLQHKNFNKKNIFEKIFYNIFQRAQTKKFSKAYDTLVKDNRIRLRLETIPAIKSLSAHMQKALKNFLNDQTPEKKREYELRLASGQTTEIFEKIILVDSLVERFPEILAEGAIPKLGGTFASDVTCTENDWNNNSTTIDTTTATKYAKYIDTLLQKTPFPLEEAILVWQKLENLENLQDHFLLKTYAAILQANISFLSKNLAAQKQIPAKVEKILAPPDCIQLDKDKIKQPYFLPLLGIPESHPPSFCIFTKRDEVPPVHYVRLQRADKITGSEIPFVDLKIDHGTLTPLDEESLMPRIIAAYYLLKNSKPLEAIKMLDLVFANKNLSDDEIISLNFLYTDAPEDLKNRISEFVSQSDPYQEKSSKLWIDLKKTTKTTLLKPQALSPLPPPKKRAEAPPPKIHAPKPPSSTIVSESNKLILEEITASLTSTSISQNQCDELKPQVQARYAEIKESFREILSKDSTQKIAPTIRTEYKKIYETVQENTVSDSIKTELIKIAETQQTLCDEKEKALLLITHYALPKDTKLNIQELLILYGQHQLESLFGTNRDKVLEALQSYIDVVQEAQRSQRLLTILSRTGEIDPKKQKEDFLKTIEERPLYDKTLYPEFQVFELFLNIFMRQEQLDGIQKLENANTSAIVQLIMGSGKTFLMLPLLGMMRANGYNISTIMLPDHLIPKVRSTLSQTLGRGAHRLVAEIPLPKGPIKEKDLERINRILDNVQQRRGVLLTSPNTKHILINSFKLFLDEYRTDSSNETKKKKVQLMAQILQKLENSESVIGDEIDTLLKTDLQYIIPIGNPIQYDRKNSTMVMELLFDALKIADKEDIQLNFDATTKSTRAPYTPEFYDTKMCEQLAQQLAQQHFSSYDPTKIITYLKTREKNTQNQEVVTEAEKYVEELEESVREQLAEMRFAITHVLRASFSKKPNENYGLNIGTAELIARPFAAVDTPTETQFSNPIEQLTYTILSYKKLGVSREILQGLQASNPKLYQTIFKNLSLDEAVIQLQTEDKLLQKFIQQAVFPRIQVYPERITSTPQKLVASSKSFSGISGTFHNIASMPKFEEENIHPDYKTEHEMLVRFLKKERSQEITVSTIPKETSSYSEMLLKKIESNRTTKTLIDSGGWLSDISGEAFAKKILEQRPDVHAVIFHTQKGERVVLQKGEAKAIPFSDALEKSIPVDQRFTLYQQNYTVGVDIKQLENARSIMTIGPNMILRDFEQAIFRMRGILEKQTCDILVDEEVIALMKNKLASYTGENNTLLTLYRFFITNQVTKSLEETYSSAHQKVESIFESAIKDAIITSVLKDDFDTVDAILAQGRRFLISEEIPKSFDNKPSFSSWEKYGAIPKLIPREEKIQKEIAAYRLSFQAVQSIPAIQVALAKSGNKPLYEQIAACYETKDLDTMIPDRDLDTKYLGIQTVVQETQDTNQSQEIWAKRGQFVQEETNRFGALHKRIEQEKERNKELIEKNPVFQEYIATQENKIKLLLNSISEDNKSTNERNYAEYFYKIKVLMETTQYFILTLESLRTISDIYENAQTVLENHKRLVESMAYIDLELFQEVEPHFIELDEMIHNLFHSNTHDIIDRANSIKEKCLKAEEEIKKYQESSRSTNQNNQQERRELTKKRLEEKLEVARKNLTEIQNIIEEKYPLDNGTRETLDTIKQENDSQYIHNQGIEFLKLITEKAESIELLTTIASQNIYYSEELKTAIHTKIRFLILQKKLIAKEPQYSALIESAKNLDQLQEIRNQIKIEERKGRLLTQLSDFSKDLKAFEKMHPEAFQKIQQDIFTTSQYIESRGKITATITENIRSIRKAILALKKLEECRIAIEAMGNDVISLTSIEALKSTTPLYYQYQKNLQEIRGAYNICNDPRNLDKVSLLEENLALFKMSHSEEELLQERLELHNRLQILQESIQEHTNIDIHRKDEIPSTIAKLTTLVQRDIQLTNSRFYQETAEGYLQAVSINRALQEKLDWVRTPEKITLQTEMIREVEGVLKQIEATKTVLPLIQNQVNKLKARIEDTSKKNPSFERFESSQKILEEAKTLHKVIQVITPLFDKDTLERMSQEEQLQLAGKLFFCNKVDYISLSDFYNTAFGATQINNLIDQLVHHSPQLAFQIAAVADITTPNCITKVLVGHLATTAQELRKDLLKSADEFSIDSEDLFAIEEAQEDFFDPVTKKIEKAGEEFSEFLLANGIPENCEYYLQSMELWKKAYADIEASLVIIFTKKFGTTLCSQSQYEKMGKEDLEVAKKFLISSITSLEQQYIKSSETGPESHNEAVKTVAIFKKYLNQIEEKIKARNLLEKIKEAVWTSIYGGSLLLIGGLLTAYGPGALGQTMGNLLIGHGVHATFKRLTILVVPRALRYVPEPYREFAEGVVTTAMPIIEAVAATAIQNRVAEGVNAIASNTLSSPETATPQQQTSNPFLQTSHVDPTQSGRLDNMNNLQIQSGPQSTIPSEASLPEVFKRATKSAPFNPFLEQATSLPGQDNRYDYFEPTQTGGDTTNLEALTKLTDNQLNIQSWITTAGFWLNFYFRTGKDY